MSSTCPLCSFPTPSSLLVPSGAAVPTAPRVHSTRPAIVSRISRHLRHLSHLPHLPHLSRQPQRQPAPGGPQRSLQAAREHHHRRRLRGAGRRAAKGSPPRAQAAALERRPHPRLHEHYVCAACAPVHRLCTACDICTASALYARHMDCTARRQLFLNANLATPGAERSVRAVLEERRTPGLVTSC